MSSKDSYTREERDRLAAQVNAGGAVVCPRCGAVVTVSAVSAPPDVSYVRKRALAVCANCHRSVAVDLQR